MQFLSTMCGTNKRRAIRTPAALLADLAPTISYPTLCYQVLLHLRVWAHTVKFKKTLLKLKRLLVYGKAAVLFVTYGMVLSISCRATKTIPRVNLAQHGYKHLVLCDHLFEG